MSVAPISPPTPALPLSVVPQPTVAASTAAGSTGAATPSTGPAPTTNSHPLVQATYEPTSSPPGGVYKIVEKDTGQVILELPFRPAESNSAQSQQAAAQQVDLTA